MVTDAGTLPGDMEVPQLIEGLVQKYGSVNAAARACGMPETTMHKLYKGERNPTLKTLRLVARGYGLDVQRRGQAHAAEGRGHTGSPAHA